MIEQKYDPQRAYRFVSYARMSSDRQNPRSPLQQFDSIKSTFQRQGYPWIDTGAYRDDAISGKFVWRRPGFSQMIDDIQNNRIQIDLIVVDTAERLGRSEELVDIRRQLAVRYGVLIVTADTNFADPTTAVGRIMTVVENTRATEANRVKAHDVIRGKRDAIAQNHWPGGPPPFGHQLKSVMVERHGRQVVDHCILVPDLRCAWILKKVFQLAVETRHGADRLTAALNRDPEIPTEFKPFASSTVGRWLCNLIYTGTLVWAKNSTDIVEDIRILERNSDDKIIIKHAFCEALVDRETWDTVQVFRLARGGGRRRKPDQQGIEKDAKLLKPLAPGIAIKYCLSGLVICARCGRAMTISSNAGYKTKSGDLRRYQAYFCPASRCGACTNKRRVPEEWLWREVLVRLNKHFLSASGETGVPQTIEDLKNCEWYTSLQGQVQSAIDRQGTQDSKDRPNLEAELESIRRQIQGWRQSLGNPSLSQKVRECLEEDLARAIDKETGLRDRVDHEQRRDQSVRRLVDPSAVLDRIRRLEEILRADNPTAVNVELGHFIDCILCQEDGKVTLRICRFGAVPQLAALVGDDDENEQCNSEIQEESSEGIVAGTPRRRSIRRIQDRQAARFVADPGRFRNIPEEWFWIETFRQPERKTWADAHSEDIYALRFRADGSFNMTLNALARQFGCSRPTVQASLRIAKQKRSQAAGTSSVDAA